jgi:hypothetical protein
MIRELKLAGKNSLQVGRILEEYSLRRGVCSMSASVYDTAWVSMVQKPVEGENVWLFPESFRAICEAQTPEGGWDGADTIDEIVNTLACLLSLKRHQREEPESVDVADRVDRATQYISKKLTGWDVMSTERDAFEILIPTILDLLETEGLRLVFPDSEKLRQLNQRKMSNVDVGLLYKYPSTILHSLESFIGTIDFNKMSDHLVGGSMMASPSSTAAYLMNVSTWDESAEEYLRDAVENGRRNGEGMVTNVYPISAFEFAWVFPSISSLMQATCNLLENGLEVDALYRDKISNILGGYLEEGEGLVGFGTLLPGMAN